MSLYYYLMYTVQLRAGRETKILASRRRGGETDPLGLGNNGTQRPRWTGCDVQEASTVQFYAC